MRFFVVVLTCAVLTGIVGVAATAAQAPVEVKASDLKRSPFQAEGLTLTIRKLDDYVFASADVRDTGGGFLTLTVENSSDRFVTFNPNRLALVGSDGKQSYPGTERRGADRIAATEVRVAPGASVEFEYNLTVRVRYPAKLYYGDTRLAEVRE